MTSPTPPIVVAAISAFVVLMPTVLICATHERNSVNEIERRTLQIMRKQAIEHDYAMYGPTDGVWRWKTPEETIVTLSILDPTPKLTETPLPEISSSAANLPELFTPLPEKPTKPVTTKKK